MKYKVVHSRMVRGTGSDREVHQPGDIIEPTEGELRAFSDNLLKVEEKETVGKQEHRDVLIDVGLNPDDYDALRTLATEEEDIDGRLSHEKLIEAFAEKYAD